MLSITRFDLTAAALFIVGCVLLFSIRYIGRGKPVPPDQGEPTSTHNERNRNA